MHAAVVVFLLLFSRAPSPTEVITDRVDLIEINRTTYPHGVELEQVIFWEWSGEYRRWHVVAWIMARDIRYTRSGAEHVIQWRVGDQRRRVVASMFRETESLMDPERLNGKLFPEATRRGLTRCGSTTPHPNPLP